MKNNLNRYGRHMMRGSYTLESVFVMTICTWILMAILYCGLYVHDKIVLSSTVNEVTMSWLDSYGKIDELEWKKNLEDRLSQQLFLLKISSISQKRGLGGKTVRVRYELPISWTFLRGVLSGGEPKPTYETARESCEPVKYMWDFEIAHE